jgi:hypothetical protein
VSYQTFLVIIRGSSGGKEPNLQKTFRNWKINSVELVNRARGVKKKPRSARKPPTNRFGKVA